MTDSPEQKYKETVSCEPRQDEGLIFIKVVAMPHEDAVEFDVAQARSFAQQILSAVEVIEAGWVGKSMGPQDACGA
jgi:hypothetical protein